MIDRPWYPRWPLAQRARLEEFDRLVSLAVWNLEDRASLDPGCLLPDDPLKLRRWSRLKPAEWGKLGPQVLSFFEKTDAGWRCEWLFRDRTKTRKRKRDNETVAYPAENGHGPETGPTTQHNTTQHIRGQSAPELRLNELDVQETDLLAAPGTGGPIRARDPEFPWLDRAFAKRIRGKAGAGERARFYEIHGRTPEEPPPGWSNGKTGLWQYVEPVPGPPDLQTA